LTQATLFRTSVSGTNPSLLRDPGPEGEATRRASRDAGLRTPRFMPLPDAASLPAAADHVGFPAVIKPVFGAEALGCLRVDDLSSLGEGYERVAAVVSPETNAIFSADQGAAAALATVEALEIPYEP